MSATTIILIVFAAFVVVALFFISRHMNKTAEHVHSPSAPEEPELTERFYFGKYIAGIPDFQEDAPLVFCGVTEKDFIFRRGSKGVEIARMRRDQINDATVSRLADVPDILTAQKTLDDFSKRAQQKSKNFAVTIAWHEGGTIQKTVFEMTESNSETAANNAAQKITQWKKPRQA